MQKSITSPTTHLHHPPSKANKQTEYLYPIPFTDYSNKFPLQSPQPLTAKSSSNDSKIKSYHQLLRMKKVLACTEQKMHNRIQLFKKASEKIIKKRQQEFLNFQKIQSIKNHPFFNHSNQPETKQKQHLGKQSRRQGKQAQQLKNVRSITQNGHYNYHEMHIEEEEESEKMTAEKCLEERIQNARQMKEERERHKMIIQERNKIELNRKLQSANIIRRKRENARILKEQLENDKKEQFAKNMQEKLERERLEFQQLQKHLSHLQMEEKEALINWKKTMCNMRT